MASQSSRIPRHCDEPAGLAGAGKVRPSRRTKGACRQRPAYRPSLSTSLLLYKATIRKLYGVSLDLSPPVNGHRACCISPLTARPFGATVLLVGNERISLQANPETLAVAQSRILGPSNPRSLKLQDSTSLHLSLSRILGRSNAHHRQVDMYTTLVHANPRMLQPAP